jgi:hypothetical protein
MLVWDEVIVCVGKVLDETLINAVGLGAVDADNIADSLTEMEPLNDCTGVCEIKDDIDSKGDGEGNGLFDNVEIVE